MTLFNKLLDCLLRWFFLSKWHSLQNLLRSRIRLETSHILKEISNLQIQLAAKNCLFLFFTQFTPVKVSESVPKLKLLILQCIVNANLTQPFLTAQCLQWRRSSKNPAFGQSQVAQHWSGPPDFFSSPPSKTGSDHHIQMEFLAQ